MVRLLLHIRHDQGGVVPIVPVGGERWWRWIGNVSICRHRCRWLWLGTQFCLYSPGYVRPRVLSQMILPIEPLSALVANVSLFAGMNHKVQRQLLLSLERLHANCTDKRSLRVVALLVPRQVVLAFQGSIADVADEPPLQVVSDQVLFQETPLRIGHLALGAAEQGTSVESGRQPNLTGLWPWLLLLWRLC